MMGKKRYWTKEEDAYMVENYPTMDTKKICAKLNRSISQIYNRAHALQLNKTHEYNSMMSKKNYHLTGMKTQFKKGSIPVNKGKKQQEYMTEDAIKRSTATRFKKGNTPYNTKYDGHERISKDGYVMVRVREGKYRLKHRVIYEKHNGNIPKGMLVIFKDGNKMNMDIDNLGLVSKKENMDRNTIHNYPQPVKETIRLIAKLNKKIENAKEHTTRST